MAAVKSAPKPKGNGRVWMLGMLAGAGAVMAAPTATLIGVLLLPGLLLLTIDHEPNRPVSMIVLTSGAAMALAPLLRLWGAGGDWPVVVDLLFSVSLPAQAWAAQAGAWLAAELAPVIARLALDMRVAAQAAALRAQRTRLEEAWGMAASDADMKE